MFEVKTFHVENVLKSTPRTNKSAKSKQPTRNMFEVEKPSIWRNDRGQHLSCWSMLSKPLMWGNFPSWHPPHGETFEIETLQVEKCSTRLTWRTFWGQNLPHREVFEVKNSSMGKGRSQSLASWEMLEVNTSHVEKYSTSKTPVENCASSKSHDHLPAYV